MKENSIDSRKRLNCGVSDYADKTHSSITAKKDECSKIITTANLPRKANPSTPAELVQQNAKTAVS